jgi:ubiquinone/menaquinone biosynthesis C-methylase UbiE
MFADRRRAASELTRVCAPGGQVLATEFCWRTPPTAQARQVFLGQVCPGMVFDTIEDWFQIYSSAGLADVRPANIRKMAWLMPRMAKAVPYLGYILVSGRKPR